MGGISRWGLGVVVGKFLPPHRGHHYLIDSALAQVDVLEVIVCERPDDPVPGDLRAMWLRQRHPRAHVRVIDDRYDAQDSRIWAANTIEWLGRAPDVVFSSEDYGPGYAALMGSAHVSVDQVREAVPISATRIRANPYAHWDFIEAPVRAWYAKRICVLGAESTGTTTLSKALAAHYQTLWVPEYGRDYSWEKQRQPSSHWWTGEFHHIAHEQRRQEDFYAGLCNRLLICDTNELATHLWHRRYLGFDDPQMAAIASNAKADLYILTGDDVPYEYDGLREGEDQRPVMQQWFREALQQTGIPWCELRGSPEARVVAAIQRIGELFA